MSVYIYLALGMVIFMLSILLIAGIMDNSHEAKNVYNLKKSLHKASSIKRKSAQIIPFPNSKKKRS